jgi:hypothetical protein
MANDSDAATSNPGGATCPTRGDHPYVDILATYPGESFAKNPVGEAEISAIDKRRFAIKERPAAKDCRAGRDRTGDCPLTGLALSGGGIRSAAFNLGALQAFHAYSGIEGIDYLSTVSGGGYIGCSLSTALAGCGDTNADFPFTNADPRLYDDTPTVHHIRDYSNYLMPHGALDAVSSIYVIGRGLVANALVVAPVLFFFTWFTLFNHPTVKSLTQPSVLLHAVWSHLPFLSPLKSLASELHGFWLTAILASVNILFLILWAGVRSLRPALTHHFANVFVRLSKILFYVTLICLVFDVQILLLKLEAARLTASVEASAARPAASVEASACASDWACSLLWTVRDWLESASWYLAIFGAAFAYFSKYLSEVATAAAWSPTWIDWFKKIAAKAGLWFAALIIPLCLWDLYLWLNIIGLADDGGVHPFTPAWLSDLSWAKQRVADHLPAFLGQVTSARLYFVAFAVTLLIALFCIDLNATTLHSLYRYRLSKAFLFNPSKHDKKNTASSRNIVRSFTI